MMHSERDPERAGSAVSGVPMNIGPTFADPVARMLYAEIASIAAERGIVNESVYSPSKWAVRGIGSCLALELGPEPRVIQGKGNANPPPHKDA